MESVGAASCTPSSADDSESVARQQPPLPRRISVVGASGSGKSYLARKLSHELGIPHYELDRLRNDVDGTRLSDDRFAARVAELLTQDEWIIDGHYRSVRQLIWNRSTSIVWLDYPLSLIGARLLDRYRNKRRRAQTQTSEAPVGEPAEFASWSSRISRLFRALREPREYASLLDAAEARGSHIIRVRQPEQAEQLPASLALLGRKQLAPLGRWDLRQQRMIELLGVPGSGKSTIGDKLVSDLQCRERRNIVEEWRRQSLPVKAWYILRGLLDIPAVVGAVKFARCAGLTSRSALGRLVRMVAKRHWVRTREGTLLLHQGYLQDIWSMLTFDEGKPIDNLCIARFLHAMYRGTDPTFIYLDIDVDTATQRIVARQHGNSRLDGLAKDDIRRRLNDRIWVADMIYTAAEASGMSTRRIDGQSSVEAVYTEAMRALAARGFAPPATKNAQQG
jgi:adenylate kinase family enzyme